MFSIELDRPHPRTDDNLKNLKILIYPTTLDSTECNAISYQWQVPGVVVQCGMQQHVTSASLANRGWNREQNSRLPRKLSGTCIRPKRLEPLTCSHRWRRKIKRFTIDQSQVEGRFSLPPPRLCVHTSTTPPRFRAVLADRWFIWRDQISVMRYCSRKPTCSRNKIWMARAWMASRLNTCRKIDTDATAYKVCQFRGSEHWYLNLEACSGSRGLQFGTAGILCWLHDSSYRSISQLAATLREFVDLCFEVLDAGPWKCSVIRLV